MALSHAVMRRGAAEPRTTLLRAKRQRGLLKSPAHHVEKPAGDGPALESGNGSLAPHRFAVPRFVVLVAMLNLASPASPQSAACSTPVLSEYRSLWASGAPATRQ